MQDMHSVGVTPAWASLSLNPLSTERALQWTLPAIGMFLAVRWMSQRQRVVMLSILFAGAIGLLVLGVLLHGASESDSTTTANAALAKTSLALTTVHAGRDPVATDQSIAGLFSNHNHFATFLAMTLPLIVAMGIAIWLKHRKGKSKRWLPWAALLSMAILALLVGMFETRSRAALVLGGLGLVGSLALMRHLGLNRKLVWALTVGTLLGSLIVVELAASATLARLDEGPSTNTRWQIHATTLRAADHFGLLGSGLGTFVQAYQTVSPEKDIGPYFINRAHSDYHELWLETGVPGLLLIGGYMGWFVWSSWRVWRGPGEHRTATLVSRAATLSIAMVLLHSYFDYPLRKTTILVMFGMSCALLAPGCDGGEKEAHKKRIANT